MSCLVVKMASVYKKGREARGALLEREVLLRQVRCSLLRPPPSPLPSDFRSPLRIGGEQARRWNAIYSLSLESRRDETTRHPLPSLLLRKCRARFRIYRSHVWRLRAPMVEESRKEWMENEWPRDEVVGSWNETRGQTCRIKGFCNWVGS